jgi:hypothetical protein
MMQLFEILPEIFMSEASCVKPMHDDMTTCCWLCRFLTCPPAKTPPVLPECWIRNVVMLAAFHRQAKHLRMDEMWPTGQAIQALEIQPMIGFSAVMLW